MEKHKINVPGAAELAQPRTRRDFFKALAAAGMGAAAGSMLLTGRASAQTQELDSDVDIANFALVLEFLEAEYYTLAVDSGMLSGEALSVVTALRDAENAHAQAIIELLQGAGATPAEAPEFTFPDSTLASQAAILETAATLEPVGVGAYIGAAPLIKSDEILAAAASIEVIEGEHVVAVNDLLGVVPPANTAFPEALTQDEVLEAIAPFVGMAEMPDTGGIAPSSR